jgi:hypothetical protein
MIQVTKFNWIPWIFDLCPVWQKEVIVTKALNEDKLLTTVLMMLQ